MRTALLAAVLAGTAFVASPAQAIHPSCDNEPGDHEVADTVGVDSPGGDNGIVGVCVRNHFVGVRVVRDETGTCVGVIVNNTNIGCT